MNAPHTPAQFKTRKTNVAEIRALIEAGLMDHQDPYELIDGVLYEMPSEGWEHIDLKNLIGEALIRSEALRAERVIIDSTLYLNDENAPEPDIYVFPRKIAIQDLKPTDVSLVVEVANSSLRKDIDVKAPLYARFGIKDLWIVDIAEQETLVFRLGADGTYTEAERVSADQAIECSTLPGLSLRLADLRA